MRPYGRGRYTWGASWGHIFRDWPTLVAAGDEIRYIGDVIALVQSVYGGMHGITAILALPPEKVRVMSKCVGGAFGG